ncbi:MAG TPA: DUF2303 family protein [Planctomycetaceae bacterium]
MSDAEAKSVLWDVVGLATSVGEAKRQLPGGDPYTVIPDGFHVEDLSRYMGTPSRPRGTVALYDLVSFIAYVTLHKLPASAVYGFCNAAQGVGYCAVLNETESDDGGIAPYWRDWRATYNPPTSPEWQVWIKANGQKMAQAEFAEFIEQNSPDIVQQLQNDPDAARMMEVATTLQATTSAQFGAAIRLSNGSSQFKYHEDITATAGNGAFEVPEKFAIGIPVFQNGPAYCIQARLRFRLNSGKLSFWYDLVRPHKIIEAAAADLTEHIKTETGLPFYNGNP